jgi:F-type H+-transporting ATPase subunit a
MMSTLFTLAADSPVGHVINHKAVTGELFGMKDVWLWSGHVGNLLLAGAILCIVGPFVAGRIATGPESQGPGRYVTKNPFAHMIEVVCTYLREQVVRPLLHNRTDKFIGFLWTLFFFIWVSNLLGMVPLLDLQLIPQLLGALSHAGEMVAKGDNAGAWAYVKGHEHLAYFGGTATQSLFTTAVLAVVSFLVVNFAGIRELGLGGYLSHLTGGAPWYVWPLIIPVEIVGTFVKPFALAIRLFANMTAGHILFAALLGFVGTGVVTLLSGGIGNLIIGPVVALVAGGAAIAIFFLEVFVATLQAFVFTFLTAVFISQLAHHHDHDHDHGHSHDHGHGHGHEHAHA